MTRATTARRLQALAAAAVLAMAVLLAGGPTTAAGGLPAAFPNLSQIDPATLPRGAAPTTLHTEGRSIVDGRVTIRTDLSGRLQIVGRAESGYLVVSRDDEGSRHTLWRVGPDGFSHRLRELGRHGDDIRVSPDHKRVVWTQPGFGADAATRVLAVRSSDGTVVGAHRFRGTLQVLDVGRRVLLDGFRPDRTIRWRPATDRVTATRGLQLAQADLSRDRAVVIVRDEVHGFDGICFAYAPLSSPTQELWRSCDDKPLSFSPDGSLVVSTFIEADGPGTGMLQVRAAETNAVRATLRTGGFFVFPYWADDDAFLVHTWRKGRAAIVRVARDGTVQRVSKVVAEDGGDDALRWSFPPS